MRTIGRFALIVSLVMTVSISSVLVGRGDDSAFGRQLQKDTHRSLIQRILDYLDNKLSTPPG